MSTTTTPLSDPTAELRSEIRQLRQLIAGGRGLERQAHLARLQAYEETLLASPRYAVPGHLARHGHQVFSQHGEDGIIAEIFRRIGVAGWTFVELGIGDGLENNTAWLLAQGWRGAWVDGSERGVAQARDRYADAIARGRLRLARALITMANVDAVLAALGAPAEPDLLSLDLDRNTWWIWQALSAVRPRAVVVEYNAQFPPDADWTVPYEADRWWRGSMHFGASLSAFERLGREKGYALVGCTIDGVNAFFVRDDLCGDRFAAPFTAAHHYEPPRYFLIRRLGYAAATDDAAR